MNTIERTHKAFIGRDERWVLADIRKNCYFANDEEREFFFKQVCESVGADCIAEIYEDDFEIALNKAIELWHKRGDEILQGKHQDNNLKRKVG